MAKKAVNGADLLAEIIEARDALEKAEDALIVTLATAAEPKDEVFLEALQSSVAGMAMYGGAITADLHGPERMAKLAEILTEFKRDELPGLKAGAAARAFDRLAPATGMLQ